MRKMNFTTVQNHIQFSSYLESMGNTMDKTSHQSYLCWNQNGYRRDVALKKHPNITGIQFNEVPYLRTMRTRHKICDKSSLNLPSDTPQGNNYPYFCTMLLWQPVMKSSKESSYHTMDKLSQSCLVELLNSEGRVDLQWDLCELMRISSHLGLMRYLSFSIHVTSHRVFSHGCVCLWDMVVRVARIEEDIMFL